MTLQKCTKCNGLGESRSHVLGWGIAIMPMKCIVCLGRGYISVEMPSIAEAQEVVKVPSH